MNEFLDNCVTSYQKEHMMEINNPNIKRISLNEDTIIHRTSYRKFPKVIERRDMKWYTSENEILSLPVHHGSLYNKIYVDRLIHYDDYETYMVPMYTISQMSIIKVPIALKINSYRR